MSESAGDCEVYRRRKSRNSEISDRQRVIGGLGRRRINQPSTGFKDRLQQFGNAVESETTDVKKADNSSSIDAPPTPSIGRRRTGDGVSSPTRRASIGSNETSPMPRRRRSSVADGKSTTTTTTASNVKNENNSVGTDWRSRLKNRDGNNSLNNLNKNKDSKDSKEATSVSMAGSSNNKPTQQQEEKNGKFATSSGSNERHLQEEFLKNAVLSLKRTTNVMDSPRSSIENISKINSIKSRLYDVNNNNENDGKGVDSDNDRLSRLKNRPEGVVKKTIDPIDSPRASFENASKYNSIRSKLVKQYDADGKDSTTSNDNTRIETGSVISNRRREASSLKSTTNQSSFKKDEQFSKKANALASQSGNTGDMNYPRTYNAKHTGSIRQNNVEISVCSPGLTRRAIQSERKLTNGTESPETDLNLTDNVKDQQISRDINKKHDEILTKTFRKDSLRNDVQKDQETSDKMILSSKPNSNNTGVKNVDSRIHAERNLTNQSESSQQKNRGVIAKKTLSEVPTKTSPSHKSSSFNGLTEQSLVEKNHKSHVNINSRKNNFINKDTKYATFEKLAEKVQTRDRSNTWTTTDSEEGENSSEVSSTEKKLNSGTDSSDSIDDNIEPTRRRRLTKKRSKRSKNQVRLIPKKNSQQSIDTSDGDILESNYTSDECGRSRPDTDEITSDGDLLISKHTSKDTYSSTANENTKILNSQSSVQKDNSTIELSFHNKKEALEKLTEKIKNSNYVNNMKSSSMTAVSEIRNLTSFPSNDMGGSRSEDEGAKLSNLTGYMKIKDGPIGSFTSIERVSTRRLTSFVQSDATIVASPLLSQKRIALSSEDKPHTTSSYTEISNVNQKIATNPFSLDHNSRLIGSREGRYSDGEQEITSRLEKQEENGYFTRSATLPRNMTFKHGLDIRKNPFSLATKTPEEQEESNRAAEVLKNLPSSSLLGRFTRDTQKMQSRSAGNLTQSLDFTQVEKDIDFEVNTNEVSTMNSLQPFNLNTIKDSINNNVDETEHKLKQDQANDTDINSPSEKDDNKSSSKILARPTLNLSSIGTDEQLSDEEYYKTLQESPGPRRRPSYIRAQNSDIDDPMTVFGIPKVQTSIEEGQECSEGQKVKRFTKRSRPQLPGMLTGIPIEPKENNTTPVNEHDDSDSDELPSLDFSKVEKVESKRARPRPPLAQPPILEGIPEEKGHGQKQDDLSRKRRSRRPVLANVFPEATITEETSRELDCDSPKTDERETGYYSQGSDLLSTPKDLSTEDLSSDCDVKIVEKTENLKRDDTSESVLNENPLQSSSLKNTEHNPQQASASTISIGASERSVVSIISNDDSGIGDPPDTPVSPQPPQEASEAKMQQPPPTKKKTPKPEMRRHVLQNLLETERSYVTNLGTMLTMYIKPLKKPENSHIIEPSSVDEIFFQIPDILANHELFLEQLTNRVNAWSDHQIIGDIFVSSFTKNLLMDAYSSFISHFVQSKAAIRQAMNARPQFVRYIEQCSREHKEKLTLSDLLIMPVQRIPRYVLLLKDMLKYTPPEHPDFGNMQLALGEIKTLADRMNKGEEEADQAEKDVERLRDIEATIEGISDLVTSSRKFIRQDLVAEMKGSITKKDRCLFLFSDLLVCTTVRRKTHALRRGSLGLFTGQSAAELNRYKFLWKLALDDIEVSKANNPQSNFGEKEIEVLEEDIRIMNNLLALTDTISVQHQNIEFSIKELLNDVRNQIQDKQAQSPQITSSPMLSKIELQAQVDGEKELSTFIFLSAECKSSWEAYFDDAKRKLAYSRDTFPPEFQRPLPINKTRSGMQFTCAAPSMVNGFSDITNQGTICGDVWVCNSDGYVGQVCLLNMVPDAKSKACLSVCSARIVCVAAVPGARLSSTKPTENTDRHKINNYVDTHFDKKLKKQKKKSSESDEEDEVGHGAESIMAFDSDDEEEGNDTGMASPYVGAPSLFGGRMSPDGSSLGTADSIEGRDSSDYSSDDEHQDQVDSTRKVSMGTAITRGGNGYTLKASLDDLLEDGDPDEQATMWLGTEDGHIYVFHAQDAIIHRKSKMKMQLGPPVTSILYFDNKIFVALGSGELCIYKRESGNGWQISTPQIINVSITGSAIVCMTAVAGRIWCGCQNTIVLINASTLKTETNICVSQDYNKSVHKIVSSGLGVWVSVQSSATIRLYHATTYENLADVDVASAVHKMLAGADAIIRQHKAACLRVTSLLICKDLLWIGTSAGVILTNPIPSITSASTSTSAFRHGPGPSGSPHGHTGHVRFLTSVEVPKHMFKGVDQEKDLSKSSPLNNKMKRTELSSNKTDDNIGTVTLVVSGGDGYEDFRNNQQTEAVGRDDSTNHLLLWRV